MYQRLCRSCLPGLSGSIGGNCWGHVSVSSFNIFHQHVPIELDSDCQHPSGGTNASQPFHCCGLAIRTPRWGKSARTMCWDLSLQQTGQNWVQDATKSQFEDRPTMQHQKYLAKSCTNKRCWRALVVSMVFVAHPGLVAWTFYIPRIEIIYTVL